MSIPPIYRILPVAVLAAMAAVALFAPVRSVTDSWIPLMSGLEMGFLSDNGTVSILLGTGLIGAVLFSLFFLLRRSAAMKYPAVAVIFLLLLSSIPTFLQFNAVYVMLLLLVWTHFCIVEKQIFTAFMLLSLASLFYAPAIWLAPLSLIFIPLSGAPDSLKSFVKALAGFLLPHVYMLVFRWMTFDDAGIYLIKFWECMKDITLFDREFELPSLFMFIYLAYLVCRASIFALRSSTSKLVQAILKMQILSLAMLLPFFVCFDRDVLPLFPVMAYPSAVLVAFYLSNYTNTKRSRAEMGLLLLSVIINSLSIFV